MVRHDHGRRIAEVATRMRARLDERLKGFRLIGPQYAMLRLLSLEGRMTQIELGNFMAMDKATMVRMIDGIEERAQSEAEFLAVLSPSEKKQLKEIVSKLLV